MIEAVMLWNEPNNLSHWDFEIDQEWTLFAEMVRKAAVAVAQRTQNSPGFSVESRLSIQCSLSEC